jgi:hypothetical protein
MIAGEVSAYTQTLAEAFHLCHASYDLVLHWLEKRKHYSENLCSAVRSYSHYILFFRCMYIFLWLQLDLSEAHNIMCEGLGTCVSLDVRVWASQ